MNILIKLTCLVGLVIAPILHGFNAEEHTDAAIEAPTTLVAETAVLRLLNDIKHRQKKSGPSGPLFLCPAM